MAHRGVADREDEQDDRDDDVHERNSEQLSDREAGGHAAGYDGQRRGRGDHEEHDVRNTQRAAVQVRRLRLLGGAVSPSP